MYVQMKKGLNRGTVCTIFYRNSLSVLLETVSNFSLQKLVDDFRPNLMSILSVRNLRKESYYVKMLSLFCRLKYPILKKINKNSFGNSRYI